MDRHVLAPISLTYRGLDADEHQIDLVQVGQSLQGVGRIYNSVAHFYFHGQIPARRTNLLIRTYTGHAEPGCVTFVLLMSTIAGYLPAYSEIIRQFADEAISKLLEAVFARRTRNDAAMEKALEAIQHMHDKNVSLVEAVLNDRRVTENRLFELVDKLVDSTSPAMSNMSAPVGQTCSSITHFNGTPRQIIVDEVTADVMRSREELEVGNQAEFIATILGVDMATGACHIKLENGQEKRGKITDPALRQAHNVYTSALDSQRVVRLVAKPVLKNGEISRLYISDATKV